MWAKYDTFTVCGQVYGFSSKIFLVQLCRKSFEIYINISVLLTVVAQTMRFEEKSQPETCMPTYICLYIRVYSDSLVT